MRCVSTALTLLGALLAVGAVLLAWREVFDKQRQLERTIEGAKSAYDRDTESGDPDLPELRAALGREHIQNREILWLPELFALRLSMEQFRSLRIQSLLIAVSVVLSTIGSLLGS